MDLQKPATALSDSGTRRKQSKLVQVVQNFFTKTSSVIAQARSVSDTKQSPFESVAPVGNSASAKINKWFNLHMPSLDSEWAKQELKPWKSQADLSQFPPMIIETFLDLRQLSACEMVMLEDDHGGCWPVAEGGSKKSEVVLERWLVEFDRSPAGLVGSNGGAEELPSVYKQAIVLLRVIYGIVRLLPAYKAKKAVAKSGNKNLTLKNRLIDGKQPVNSKGRVGLSKSIVPHQMLVTESHMMQREFAPIHTSLGTLRVSVAYRNHYKFAVQDQEERLSNHFILSDHERSKGSQESRGRSSVEDHSHPESVLHSERNETENEQKRAELVRTSNQTRDVKQPRGSFGSFQEKYSVSPCTSELREHSPSKIKKHGSATIVPAPTNPRPSIQPFRVGSIGSSSSPPYSTLNSTQASGGSSSMERRISITSNRSGSNASLVALLRNPRGSTSSSNTPNVNANVTSNTQSTNTSSMPRSISSSHGSHIPPDDHIQDSSSNTPRFSSSFGSRQSRRFSNTSARFTAGANAESNVYYGTSVESASSVPFSGLYADDDISSFVQMIDGTSELRLSNSNHDSKIATPNNESSTHFEALNRFQLLKSHYQHLSDSVSASLVLQQNQSRSPSDDRLATRRSSRSTGSPAPSLPVGSYENTHMPSISSRLSKLSHDKSQSSIDLQPENRAAFEGLRHPKLQAEPSTATTMAHAAPSPHPGSSDIVVGLATSPSVYQSTKRGITYEDVFDEDDEGIDYYSASHHDDRAVPQKDDMSFDHDDLLFEMTDTR